MQTRSFTLPAFAVLALLALAGEADAQSKSPRPQSGIAAHRPAEQALHAMRIAPSYDFQDGNAALQDDIVFPIFDGRDTVVVPAGFVTDYASIPRTLRRLLHGNHNRPAILHDYLYWRQCDQSLADQIFRDELEAMGIPALKRKAMYVAVRLFGSRAHAGNRRERDAHLPRIIPADYLPPPIGDWPPFRKALRDALVPLDAMASRPPPDCPVRPKPPLDDGSS